MAVAWRRIAENNTKGGGRNKSNTQNLLYIHSVYQNCGNRMPNGSVATEFLIGRQLTLPAPDTFLTHHRHRARRSRPFIRL